MSGHPGARFADCRWGLQCLPADRRMLVSLVAAAASGGGRPHGALVKVSLQQRKAREQPARGRDCEAVNSDGDGATATGIAGMGPISCLATFCGWSCFWPALGTTATALARARLPRQMKRATTALTSRKAPPPAAPAMMPTLLLSSPPPPGQAV
eukprot:scaffold6868_cov202-Prasinococcus_capsulatus_cf.AAC.1